MAYVRFEDGEKTKMISTVTGEITNAVTATYPEGTWHFTPDDQEAYRAKKEQERRKEYSKCLNSKLGRFFFAAKEQDFEDLQPATVARLFYLCSYLDPATNKLMKNRSTPIYRRDLPDLLRLSKSASSEFVKEASPKYVRINEDKTISVNNSVFSVGKMRMSPPVIKVYKNAVKKLFERVDPPQVRYLGHAFALLSYINEEYNILCRNVDEKELDNIAPITLKEFCDLIDYDYTHLNRLKQIYKKLRFNVEGEMRRLVSFCNDDQVIVINPRVLYSGSNYEKVEAFALFFRD